MQKPSIPKGTRDFTPFQISRRNYIFNSIKSKFEKFGFSPIETPSMEKLTTLNGKYGTEGDQLLFKVLKRGAKFEKVLSNSNTNTLKSNDFSDEALRYDLTVPFARYIVQHQNDISFPFKRYQIQPVWRADRPQKGRYREFYQCDADIVGTKSLICEIELISLISEVLNEFKLTNHSIMINNRKILSALIDLCHSEAYFSKITVIIDKIDKIGVDNVVAELKENIPNSECWKLFEELFSITGSENILEWLNKKLTNSEVGQKGIEELIYIVDHSKKMGIKNLKINISLARGLDYYTGSIFEVILNDSSMGSIVGGGRYDDLTKMFGQNNLSGVGISFGAERIFDLMNDLNLFPDGLDHSPKYMIIDQSGDSINGLKLLNYLRDREVSTILYPDEHKIKKQLKYAHLNNISFVVFINQEFHSKMQIELKDMKTGVQEQHEISNLN